MDFNDNDTLENVEYEMQRHCFTINRAVSNFEHQVLFLLSNKLHFNNNRNKFTTLRTFKLMKSCSHRYSCGMIDFFQSTNGQ